MLAFLLVFLALPAVTSAVWDDDRSCAEQLAEQNKRKNASEGLFVGMCDPRCKEDGTFEAVQCCGAGCFCSDPSGQQILDYGVPVWEAANMTCACALEDKEIRDAGLYGRYVWCERNGDYQPIQCEGSVCYCVDPKTGVRLDDIDTPIGTRFDCPRLPLPS